MNHISHLKFYNFFFSSMAPQSSEAYLHDSESIKPKNRHYSQRGKRARDRREKIEVWMKCMRALLKFGIYTQSLNYKFKF